MTKLDQELYEMRVEPLGADAVDFITNDATYIRIEVLVKGKVKVIPEDLIESIAKLIREYDLKEKNGSSN